ncbi:23S rRNA (pseudouridine(1915)-N(3))-methyltransferase RlmH [Candidatus Contubernalis alkaliaceticus]|uniref:23S rRNA (pseudouridine(1915)-N(3))-methyltransferase RlmH n=1 Tax=Candidatus Contubernalis alkaliaceticus TaxID=338645 RepID=UPI001F4BD963|nr:23S rRNA (pseudouridine(1915)-N(3))-methyltransferase RlmH [Candidatus Contubernalis alkalaceticus]UNC93698.1 23S rRNA (pseudouridine(1915)-N(3))-methyltransferase RlmH [Candidatus Contubernalis alkalaceticus]
MHIKIIAVGRLKEKYLLQGVSEYSKRLKKYARVEILEISDEKVSEKFSPAQEETLLKKEGERILKLLEPGSFLVVMALEGKQLSSEQLAEKMEGLALGGRSKIFFVIGGALGLSPTVKKRADLLLSFSPMTFPHQLTRLILLEQLYRAFKIIKSEPYHK